MLSDPKQCLAVSLPAGFREIVARKWNASMRSARAGELSEGRSAAVIRSLLYVPASSERFIAKAHERGADAIILDLEDAVAPQEKERARATLTEAVPSVGRNGAKVFVRINALATGLAL